MMSKKFLHCWTINSPYLRLRTSSFRSKFHRCCRCQSNEHLNTDPITPTDKKNDHGNPSTKPKEEVPPSVGGIGYFQKLAKNQRYNIQVHKDVNELSGNINIDQNFQGKGNRNLEVEEQCHFVKEETEILKNDSYKSEDDPKKLSTVTGVDFNRDESALNNSINKVEKIANSIGQKDWSGLTDEELRSMSYIEELGSRSSVEELRSESSIEEANSSVDLTNKIEYNSLEYDSLSDEDGSMNVLEELPLLEETDDADSSLVVSKPVAPLKPSYTLAPYVDKSEVLTNLVNLGVDLSLVEKKKGAADILVKLDYKKDVEPYLYFLRDVGVSDDNLANVITKNPYIFEESIENLQIKLNYLKSKRFSEENITHIVTKAPLSLIMKVERIDRKLGFYQKEFNLNGNEVRTAITILPKLITWNMEQFKDLKFYIKEFLGFTDVEMKKIFLTVPKVFLKNKYELGKKFEYLHSVMGLTHEKLLQWPKVFDSRLFIIKERHKYLVSLGRAQYDPTRENYVSLKALVTGRDKDWCIEVAKTSHTQFNQFLKTL